MSTETVNAQTTLRERLIEAADDELAEYGSLTGRFEAVAHRAGVSRATAYRQMGSVSELLTQVGLRRARNYVDGLREVMDRETGVLAKLEASLVFGARELPKEPMVLRLIVRQFSSAGDPEFHGLINDVVRSMMVAGQRSGEIRNDIDLDFMIGYITEQSWLTTRNPDRSPQAVRRRFRTFIAPAIMPAAADVHGPRECQRVAGPSASPESGAGRSTRR